MSRAQPQLFSKGSVHAPYYVDGNLSLKRFADFLGASQSDLAHIIGREARTVDRDVPSKQVFERIKPLLYAMKLLLEIAEPKEIKRWLHEPLIEWRGKSPMDELMRGNIEGVVNLVERLYRGEGAY